MLENGRALTVTLDDREGGLLSIQEGRGELDDHEISEGDTVSAGSRRPVVRREQAE
jgi:hypothetical protein